MKCQQNFEFIQQALLDYSNTLSPSASAGFEQLALHHLNAVAGALEEPEKDKEPAPPEEE